MKTFIEIGACDFDTLNHLADYGWRGIIVDPMKKYLDKLDRKPNVEYISAAVSDSFGETEFYEFKQEIVEQDHDFAGMSSIHPISANLHLMNKLRVNKITYSSLLETQRIDRVDYLKIDTEGHDMIILKTVIFKGPVRPKVIKVEHKHCDQLEMESFLKQNGYHVEVESQDIFAIDIL
jgi:FkbM family methyltransferase